VRAVLVQCGEELDPLEAAHRGNTLAAARHLWRRAVSPEKRMQDPTSSSLRKS
jgi:hypothetical protein